MENNRGNTRPAYADSGYENYYNQRSVDDDYDGRYRSGRRERFDWNDSGYNSGYGREGQNYGSDYDRGDWRSGRGSQGPASRNWGSDYGRLQNSDYEENQQRRGAYRSFDTGRDRDYGRGGYNANEWNEPENYGRGYGGYGHDYGNRGSYRSSMQNEPYRSSFENQRYDYGSEDNDYLTDRNRSRSYGSYYGDRNWNYDEGRGSYPGMGNPNRGYEAGYGRDYGRSYESDQNEYNPSIGRSSEGHRGKGPKGYQRSDRRIEEDVNDGLSDDSQIDASDIEVTVQNGEVTLTGTVKDKRSKRRAEDITEDISGVNNVENKIHVSGEGSASTSSRKTQSSTNQNKKSNSQSVSDKQKEKSHA